MSNSKNQNFCFCFPREILSNYKYWISPSNHSIHFNFINQTIFTNFFRASYKTQDGRVQVHVRTVPQEAKRCHALPSPHPLLAIQATGQGPSRPQVHPPRQGQASRLQKQARLRHLPHRHASRRPKKAGRQRLSLWQTQDFWCRHPIETRPEPAIHRWGTCRSSCSRTSCLELLLVMFNLDLFRNNFVQKVAFGSANFVVFVTYVIWQNFLNWILVNVILSIFVNFGV